MRWWSTQWIRGALLPSLLLLTPTEPGSTPMGELEVVVGGCFEWRAAVCVLRDKEATLTLWLDTDAESIPMVHVDGAEVSAEWVAVAGGIRIAVEVPAEAEAVSLYAPRCFDAVWILATAGLAAARRV